MMPTWRWTSMVTRTSTTAAAGSSHIAVLRGAVAWVDPALSPAVTVACIAIWWVPPWWWISVGEASLEATPPPPGRLPSGLLKPVLSVPMSARAEDEAAPGAVMARLSVLGEVFDIALAAALVELTPADLLRELDTGPGTAVVSVEAGMVRFGPGERARHYAALGAKGQAEAHARAAETISRLRPGDLAAVAAQRAGAIALLGAPAALDAFDAAVEASLHGYDWVTAAALLGQAEEIAMAHHDPRAGRLALMRARALYRQGSFHEAIAAVRAAARFGRQAGDSQLRAEAALAIRGIGDRDLCAELLDLCREALRELREGTSDDELALRARLVAQQAILTAELAHSPADPGRAAESLRLAEASADPRAIIEALHATQVAHSGPREVDLRQGLADRAESLAVEAGLDDLLTLPLGWRVDALFQLGDRPALDEAVARLAEHGANRNDGLASWKSRMALAVIAQVEGRFDDAERLGGEAVKIARRGEHAGAEFIYRILISYCRGLTIRGGPDDRPIEDFPLGGEVMLAFPAMEQCSVGDLETAAVLFDRAFPAIADIAGRELEVQTYCALAMAAWALERVDAAPVLRAALAPFSTQMGVSATGQAACMGSIARFMGEMAALTADWEAVEIDFALAMRRNMEFGNRPAVAETRVDWARSLLRRGLARDRERALALLEAAERDAARLGMAPLRKLATASLDELRRGPGHTLSARELEVATLVAEGLSNKEVAARLHLSVRTAENHLLNVMNKLGLDNRASVAAWVTRTQAATRG
jgi:DNA-binding CsgD family transcriptional regulator